MRVEVKISGIVQGVGFRPFIVRVAKLFWLNGFVANGSQGVLIEFEGIEESIKKALEYITSSCPNSAIIDSMKVEYKDDLGYKSFIIKESQRENTGSISLTPDLGLCEDCKNEMDAPNSRFYKYPFVSCVNCGPRFTILEGLPYDRPYTSMNNFEMCEDCKKEYQNPEDRRYHAQTISCEKCGPELSDTLDETIKALKLGKIVAIKGVGGYHLACDARNDAAVRLLRDRKRRHHKPFALMMNLEETKRQCEISQAEEDILKSPLSPIVLLAQGESADISKKVNPGLDNLGVMLPYTGIHKLLLEEVNALVMTSGNISSEPIITTEEDVEVKLELIADKFLHHNRRIVNGCDDSVVRCFGDKSMVIRRSRGFMPTSIKIGGGGPDILALGSDLKNTFAIYTKGSAYISQHIGDLESKNTFDWYVNNINIFKKLLGVDPKIIVCDFHPEYQSTKYASMIGNQVLQVRHHHAHITAVMGEHGLDEEVIGVAFDGTGYGDDGNLWGGEFFVAARKDYDRILHFEYTKMPGGEAAVREPWRMAASYLYDVFGELPDIEFSNRINKNDWTILERFLKSQPQTSSVGRLFDAVSSLIGIRDSISYEGQAAIELEAVAEAFSNEGYPFEIIDGVISVKAMFKEIVKELKQGINKSIISGKFHNTIVDIVLEGCRIIRKSRGINKVVLSGGVFQNILLLSKSIKSLKKEGFEVYYGNKVPVNDGGISLGQLVTALEKLKYNSTQ